jgi:arginine/ornithine N-succinyltransferase beta subunit
LNSRYVKGGPLRSNNQFFVDEAKYLAKQGTLTIHENLKKNEYYELLADSRVMFNCALQDWVSNTVSVKQMHGLQHLVSGIQIIPRDFRE